MTRIPHESRDAEGNIVIRHQIDPKVHNSSPSYRAEMREILYRKNKPLQTAAYSSGEKNTYETSSRHAYGQKSLDNVKEAKLYNQKLATYFKGSHFSLENSDSTEFSSTTKEDYPKHFISAPARGFAAQHQIYPPVFVDENLGSKIKSLYKSSFKPSALIRNIPISLKEKGKSHFEFGVDEPDFKANRNEPNSQSTANFMDIQKEKNGIKKLNSTSYVLNCPDTEIPDYRSTNRNDYADFIGIDRKNLKIDPETFAEHSRGTHFSFGDSSLANIHSEYISTFDSTSLKNSRPAKSQRFEGTRFHFQDDIGNDTSPLKSQFATDFVAHPTQMSSSKKEDSLKAINYKSSILFGADSVESATVTKSEFTAKIGNPNIVKSSRNFNDLISMSSALPQSLSFKPESTTRASFNDSGFSSKEAKPAKSFKIKEEKSHHIYHDGEDERFVKKPVLDIDFSESVRRYRSIKLARYAEGSFEQTNSDTIHCTNKLDSITSSESYGNFTGGPEVRIPVRYLDNGALLGKDATLESAINLSRISYVLPEIQKTRDGVNYTDIVAKEKKNYSFDEKKWRTEGNSVLMRGHGELYAKT